MLTLRTEVVVQGIWSRQNITEVIKDHGQVSQFQVAQNQTGSQRLRYVRDRQDTADMVNQKIPLIIVLI